MGLGLQSGEDKLQPQNTPGSKWVRCVSGWQGVLWPWTAKDSGVRIQVRNPLVLPGRGGPTGLPLCHPWPGIGHALALGQGEFPASKFMGGAHILFPWAFAYGQADGLARTVPTEGGLQQIP